VSDIKLQKEQGNKDKPRPAVLIDARRRDVGVARMCPAHVGGRGRENTAHCGGDTTTDRVLPPRPAWALPAGQAGRVSPGGTPALLRPRSVSCSAGTRVSWIRT
jgi:hypothetical protein